MVRTSSAVLLLVGIATVASASTTYDVLTGFSTNAAPWEFGATAPGGGLDFGFTAFTTNCTSAFNFPAGQITCRDSLESNTYYTAPFMVENTTSTPAISLQFDASVLTSHTTSPELSAHVSKAPTNVLTLFPGIDAATVRFIAPTGGYYFVQGYWEVLDAATSLDILDITKDGNPAAGFTSYTLVGTETPWTPIQSFQTTLYLAAGSKLAFNALSLTPASLRSAISTQIRRSVWT